MLGLHSQKSSKGLQLFSLNFETKNSAFDDGGDGIFEVMDTISWVHKQLRRGVYSGLIRDNNGNSIGNYEYTPDNFEVEKCNS